MRLILRLFLLCLFITNGVLALAQVSFDSQEELEKAAGEFFESKQYDKAKPLYSQLLSLNALNPNYNYRFGVCILYTEADPLKPLPYIEGGANTTGVSNEAYYFLGKAYQFNYRFDDAIAYFDKAKKSGFTAADVDLNRSIEECRNGKLLYSEMEFTPAQNKEVIESEFYRPYDFRRLKGKVIPMPPNFKTKYDQKNLKGTVVYTPSNSQTLIYASYGEDGANGKDLYRVNRLPNGEWALPQRLPDNINTKYDEDFAFFDDESSTLFFASKGHNTMGGFDIFRSVYSAESNTWSQPTNLQYPINSPFDDFLYVSDPNGKVAFFTSRRDSDLEKLRVFKTLLHDASQVEMSVVEGTYEDRTDSVFNYMLATVFDPKTNEVIGKYRSNKETGKYVLILPPQNDYKLDVGPNESAGFQFDLDVPKHEETKPLQQSIAYDANGSDGTVIVTNYFNAAGKKDSIALAANRSKSEVESGMVALPDPSTILASKEQVRVKEAEQEQAKAMRLAELAALEEAKLMAELAKNDSLVAVKKAAREAEALRLQAEAARKDSLAQAQEELKAKLAKEKAVVDSLAAVELALAQEREKAIADSISNAQELAAEKEQAKIDSIAEVERLAALKGQQEKAAADSLALLAEGKAAEEAKLAREQAINDSIAAVEKAAFEAEQLAKEQAKKDSVEAADLAAAARVETSPESVTDSLKEKQAKVTADSLALLAEAKATEEAKLARERAINDSIAAAEMAAFEAELAAIEQAKKDSAEAADLAAVEVETPSESVDDLLKEMQEKEAEILASQAEDKPTETVEPEPETKAEQSKEEQPVVEDVASVTTDTAQTEELISEADLFLQTIANLEKQKSAQEQAVEEENKRLAEEKANKAEAEALAKAEKAAADTSSVQNLEIALSDSVKQGVEETQDIETQSVALKSDADPNEYLAALAEMEAEMEADNAKNNKSYELRELEPMAETRSDIDPKLQQMIDADRKAIEEHQRVAQAKEKELKEQLERDKQAVSAIEVESSADEELAAIEAEMLEGLKGKKLVTKLTVDSAENTVAVEEPQTPEIVEGQEVDTKEEVETELIAEADELVNELVETEVAETPEETSEESIVTEEKIAETPKVEEASQPEKINEEAALIAEADEVVNDLLAADTELESVTEETVSEVSEELNEVVEAPKEVAVVQEESVEEVVEITAAKEASTEGSEPTQEEAKAIEAVVETKSEVVAVNEDMEVNEFGQRIPFLEPALRDYSNRPKPNFNAIENVAMRRLVKRMRSEDVGRMAVLKNMKNQWVDQGKTKESLEAIKKNERNQEVLANLVEPIVREEKIRDPFDVNDTRAREGVYYQLEFKLVTAGVSETIREAMTPEQEMTFAMPEFSITADHFGNLADARAEMRYYKQRGFDSVAVVAYLNGDRILLSDTENIPFVD